jgi:predicted SnoaL-like aldol condensation-catalyzing enzyme
VARAHPAAHSVVEDVLVDGDRVADRVTTLSITDDGSPATILEVFRITGTDGRIAELWAASTSKPLASRGTAADDR